MAPPRLVPDKVTFERWLAQGLTQKQMVDEIEATTGNRVTRAAVAAALVRYGLADRKPRYGSHLPWKVRVEHLSQYQARMLRLLGRRDAGGRLSAGDAERLDSWLAKVIAEDLVVVYDPEQGFGYTRRGAQDVGPIPVRAGYVRLLAGG